MIAKSLLQKLARKHGTPLFVIDHDELRKNYRAFRRHLPVQVYFAVKANSDPAIVRTLFKEGASFDVASMPEFMIVHENIKHLSAKTAGLDLGQNYLRESDQAHGNAGEVKSL